MSTGQLVLPDNIQNIVNKLWNERYVEKQESIEVKSPVKPGDNWVGDILEIKVVGKNRGKKTTKLNLIAKIAPKQNLYRNFLPVRNAYVREVYVYDKIIPEFINIQNENNVRVIFAPFAKCHETILDEQNEVIILEDMKKLGYKTLSHVHPVDYQHAKLFMETLGKLHALSFALQNQKPKLFEEICNNTEESFLNSHFCEPFLQIVKNLGIQALNRFDQNTDACNEFEIFIKDPTFVVDYLKNGIYSQCAVINHGDPQIRNLLYKYQNDLDNQIPTDLCMLDWQLSRIGAPVFDIAFFIWICTDKKLRDDHYEDLLEIYYNTLSCFLQELGGDVRKSYPKQVFKDQLKQLSVFGMFVAIWVISVNITNPDHIPDLKAADNLQSIIDMLSTVTNNQYYTRIEEMAIDFIKYGYNFTL